MSKSALFNTAAQFADAYDGSESAYQAFTNAAIAFEKEGGEKPEIDSLLDRSIKASYALYRVNNDEEFLEKLKNGGAQIIRHGAVFVRPDPNAGGIQQGSGASIYEGPIFEPRLQEVVKALQTKGIYFDDLVLDIGRVSDTQLRKWPYVIITIPRLNAQIAVANQYGEALFVAHPGIQVMDWALFQKEFAGVEKTAFVDIQKIIHNHGWEEKLLGAVFGTLPKPGPKILLPAYAKAHRKTQYPLTEAMIVAMAKLYRARHPEKQWPIVLSGAIDPEIVTHVTSDPNWQPEDWKNIDAALAQKFRGLSRKTTLGKILKENGCCYDLTEEIIVAMAKLYRERHPQKQWPSSISGTVDPEIIKLVTEDPYWQVETWAAIERAAQRPGRGLTRKTSLAQILDAHIPERGTTNLPYKLTEVIIIKMAELHHKRYGVWPTRFSGAIDADIVSEATGYPNWKKETWLGINQALAGDLRGLKGKTSLTKLLLKHHWEIRHLIGRYGKRSLKPPKLKPKL